MLYCISLYIIYNDCIHQTTSDSVRKQTKTVFVMNALSTKRCISELRIMEITLALIITALSRHWNGLANTISVNSVLGNRGLNSIMCCENLWSEQDNKVLIAGILPLNRKLIVLVPSIGNFLQLWGIWLFYKNSAFWSKK